MSRFQAGDIVTNGTMIGDHKIPYQYTVVAIHKSMVWVVARNGTFSGSYLTFPEDKLFAVRTNP